MISGLPFDDFRHLVANVPGPEEKARRRAADVNRRLEAGGARLGQVAKLSEWLAASSGRNPGVLRPQVAVFVGTHGIAARLGEDVSDAKDFVERCGAGRAAINQLCAAGDYGLKVFDLALDHPTGDITADAALNERGCAATMAFGMEAVAGGAGLVVLAGHGGKSGRVAAATLLSALLGASTADGLLNGGEGEHAKRALDHHDGHLSDPLEALRRIGGREIAALVGAIVAARTQKVPVLLDGLAAISAAAVLRALNPAAVDHCLVADRGGNGQPAVLEALDMTPLLLLGLDAEAGSAGAIAAGVVQSAAHFHAAAGAHGAPGRAVS